MNVRTVSTLTEVEALRAFWESVQDNPNNDYAQYCLVCRQREAKVRPHVTVVEQDGRPCTLLIGRLEKTDLTPAIGYFKPIKIPAVVLTVLNQGLVGKVDDTIAEALVQHLCSFLALGEADVIAFHHLHEHSRLLKAVMCSSPRAWCEKKPAWSTHWCIDLPEKPGELLKKMRKNHRQRTIKLQHDLQSLHGREISWRWYTRFKNIGEFCCRIEKVAMSTYQRGLSAGFINTEEYRQRYLLLSSRNQLRAQLLEIDGEISAYWIGSIYNNVFHASATGYDQALRRYEVGTVGLLRTVDDLVSEGVKVLDFGLGDAGYKNRFGNRSWREATVRLFAPTLRGLTLRYSLGAFAMCDTLGRTVVRQVGGLDRLKTVWRRRLWARGARGGPHA